MLLLSSFLVFAASAPIGPPEPALVVGIADFEVHSEAGEYGWLSQTFSAGLTTRLIATRSFRIVERASLNHVLAELDLHASERVDPATAVRVGRLVGAQVLVVGSVTVVEDEIRATARIVRVENGETLASAETRGPLRRLFAIQDALTREVGVALVPLGFTWREGGAAAVEEVPLEVLRELDRLDRLTSPLPFLGRDPARHRRVGEFELALATVDRLLEAHPRLAILHHHRALLSLQVDDLDEAETSVRVGLELLPLSVDLRLVRANLLQLTGDVEGALQVCREIVNEEPGDGRAWYVLGRLLLRERREAAAVPTLLQAIQGSPGVPAAEATLRSVVAGSRWGEVERVLVSRDADALAAARLYRADWLGGTSPEPGLVARVIDAFPLLYFGHFAHGRILRHGRPEAARNAYMRALGLRPDASRIHRDLGLLLLETGECARGEDHTRIYLATAPFIDDYPEIEGALRRCRAGPS